MRSYYSHFGNKVEWKITVLRLNLAVFAGWRVQPTWLVQGLSETSTSGDSFCFKRTCFSNLPTGWGVRRVNTQIYWPRNILKLEQASTRIYSNSEMFLSTLHPLSLSLTVTPAALSMASDSCVIVSGLTMPPLIWITPIFPFSLSLSTSFVRYPAVFSTASLLTLLFISLPANNSTLCGFL